MRRTAESQTQPRRHVVEEGADPCRQGRVAVIDRLDLLAGIGADDAARHQADQPTLDETARDLLTEQGHTLQETRIDDGYDGEAEVEKWLWADTIILQMPGWWMGTPWTVKRYLDEVLTQGHSSLYASDGRSRHDPSRQYGSGGLLQGKHYLL